MVFSLSYRTYWQHILQSYPISPLEGPSRLVEREKLSLHGKESEEYVKKASKEVLDTHSSAPWSQRLLGDPDPGDTPTRPFQCGAHDMGPWMYSGWGLGVVCGLQPPSGQAGRLWPGDLPADISPLWCWIRAKLVVLSWTCTSILYIKKEVLGNFILIHHHLEIAFYPTLLPHMRARPI